MPKTDFYGRPLPEGVAILSDLQRRQLTAARTRAAQYDTSGATNQRLAALGSTKVIAAADATPWERQMADEVCTGAHDQEKINNALLQGSVRLTSGTYYLSDSIEMVEGHELAGNSIGSTTLFVIDGADTFNAIFPLADGARGFGDNVTLENILVHDMSGDGVFLATTQGSLLARGVTVEDNDGDGLACGGSPGGTINISQLISRRNGQRGLTINGTDDATVDNFTISLNGWQGIFISDANRAHIANGLVEASGQETDNFFPNIAVSGTSTFNIIESVINKAGSEVNAPSFGVQVTSSPEDTLVMCEFPDVANFGTGDIADSGVRTRFIQVHTHADGSQGGTISYNDLDDLPTLVTDHDSLTGVSADDHHNQSHGHTGADGSGTVAHANLTGVSANQHHNQSHDHSGASDGTILRPNELHTQGIQSFTSTGTVNDFALNADEGILVWTGASSLTLTGIVTDLSGTVSTGRFLLLVNATSSSDLTLTNNDAGSTAGYRFRIDGSSNIVLRPSGSVLLVWSDVPTEAWRVVTTIHTAGLIPIVDAGLNYAATNVEDALAEMFDTLQDHATEPNDHHENYALLAGRAGGQTLKGGTASGEDLTLEATDHATKGDVIIVADALDLVTNDVQLFLGRGTSSPASTNNSTLWYRTDFNVLTVRANGLYRIAPGFDPVIWDDFMAGPGGREGWTSTLISTGTIANQAAEDDHPGIFRISSNGASNAGALLRLGADNWTLTEGEFVAICFRISASATNVRVRMGMGDGTGTGADTDAVGFQDDGSGNLRGYCINNSTQSSTGTTFGYTANTWYWALWIGGNASDTVAFYILDADGDVVADLGSLNTNLPTTRTCAPSVRFWATNTTTRTMDVDAFIYGMCSRGRSFLKKT
jgi:hypothetical protein